MKASKAMALLMTGILAAPLAPTASALTTASPGDLNGDGVCSTADLLLLQKWLLGESVTLEVPEAGDRTETVC